MCDSTAKVPTVFRRSLQANKRPVTMTAGYPANGHIQVTWVAGIDGD